MPRCGLRYRVPGAVEAQELGAFIAIKSSRAGLAQNLEHFRQGSAFGFQAGHDAVRV